MDFGVPEEIQGDDGLWDEEVPAIGGELWVSPTEDTDEVILEVLDGPFSLEGPVVAWRC